ncbi:MAG: DUF885 domain-containing protein [Planctomycetota bacterium]
MARPQPFVVAALVALPFAACEVVEKVQTVPVAEFGLWEDASGNVEDPALASLCADYWEWMLENDPIRATYVGDPRFNGDLPQLAERPRRNDLLQLDDFLERAEDIHPGSLTAFDREVHTFFLGTVAAERTRIDQDLESWTADPLRGPVVGLLNVVQIQPVRTERERNDLLERLESAPGFFRDAGMNLRRGAVEGRISSETAFRKLLAQLDDFLALKSLDNPLLLAAAGGGRWVDCPTDGNLARVAHQELNDSRAQRDLRLINLHVYDTERVEEGTRVLIPAADDPLSPETRGEFLQAALELVEDDIYPAVASYRDTVSSLLLRARPDERPGLVHLRGGDEMYRSAMAYHTSLPASQCNPTEVHEFGLAEVARIRAEMADIGERVFATRNVDEIQRRLRSDPAMHFGTAEEVRAKADESLRRATAAMGEYFGILPQAPCVVREIPIHEAPNSTIAYYEAPEAGGGRPGIYYVNTYKPETRPRYEAEVLAFHEAIPGHHLQIAIAHERQGLPLFQRHSGWTAFVEGWALYTERLSDEMGLYSGDVDRLGVLSFDAWRACRLVVDTGLHAFGWSREQAIDYMHENTLLALNNIENEVDRYIAWPGQALAYKIGQREMLNLRDTARQALGPDFRYPDFHDVVLREGGVPLTTLRENVYDWIRSRGGVLPVEAGISPTDG